MTETLVLYIAAAIIGWVIFYYVVKAAVKNAIIEARSDMERPSLVKDSEPEKIGTPEQMKLQERYAKGEISFEVYKTEWDKLNG